MWKEILMRIKKEELCGRKGVEDLADSRNTQGNQGKLRDTSGTSGFRWNWWIEGKLSVDKVIR